MRIFWRSPKRAPAAKLRDAQGVRVVPCCYPDVAEADRTESAQSYVQYGSLARVIKGTQGIEALSGVSARRLSPYEGDANRIARRKRFLQALVKKLILSLLAVSYC